MFILLLTVFGCERQPEPLQPNIWPVGSVDPVNGMRGFSWVDGTALAAMPRPAFEHLIWMEEEGIEVLVTLTESPLEADWLETAGLESVHIPIEDFQAPTQNQIDAFTSIVDRESENGRAVGVHCLAGLGRSGTMVAAWFIHEGLNAREAIELTRELRPGSIETASQEAALQTYSDRLRR